MLGISCEGVGENKGGGRREGEQERGEEGGRNNIQVKMRWRESWLQEYLPSNGSVFGE